VVTVRAQLANEGCVVVVLEVFWENVLRESLNIRHPESCAVVRPLHELITVSDVVHFEDEHSNNNQIPMMQHNRKIFSNIQKALMTPGQALAEHKYSTHNKLWHASFIRSTAVRQQQFRQPMARAEKTWWFFFANFYYQGVATITPSNNRDQTTPETRAAIWAASIDNITAFFSSETQSRSPAAS
jgi:hypothetical protein